MATFAQKVYTLFQGLLHSRGFDPLFPQLAKTISKSEGTGL